MSKKLILFLSLFGISGIVFGQIDRSKAPEPQPNPSIEIEIPDAMSFANGLRVIMVENHKLPKVSFQLYVDYPTPIEGDIAGVSSVFGELLGSGTKNTSKDNFDEQIDYMGAAFYPNSRGFYASSLKKHTPKLLALLNEVITQPAFEQEDFDRIIAQNMSGLATTASDASTMSSNVSNVMNFGLNHPYGELMTEETLGNITLDDVKAYYKKYFIPNHAYLVIVGDINADEVKEYAGEYFEPWKKGQDLKKKNYIVPNSKGKNVYFVNKPGAVQSVINITHTLDITPGHEDHITLKVLNQILGGGSFSARLLSNLREDKAYTYGCYSSISSDPLMGAFKAGGNFRNEVTDSAIVQILGEIDRISVELVTDKELDLVKKSMTGAFARSLESPQTVARFALNTVRYNLPSDYYATYLKRLERVTKEDLLMAASAYLSPENLNIVVVGNEEIADKLAVFDTDGKIDYKNYYGEDQEQLKTVSAGVTAETIIDTYVMNIMMSKSKEELASKMANVQQIETYSKADFAQAGGELIMYSAQGASNKSAALVYLKSPMMTGEIQKEWFDGNEGGSIAQGVTTTYEGEELAEKKKPSFPVSQVNYKNDPTIQVELLGIAAEEGTEYYKLKITDAEDFTLEFYDVKTGLLMKSESYVTGENGEQNAIIMTYSNYQESNGLWLPSNTTLNTQGQSLKFEVINRSVGKKVKSKAFGGNFKASEKKIGKL